MDELPDIPDLPTSLPVDLPDGPPTIDPQWVRRFEDLIDQIQATRMPTAEETLDYLTTLHPVHAVVLILVGSAYLLWGWRVFKLLLMFNAAILGATIGGALAVHFQQEQHWWLASVGAGLVLGALAWPLMNVAVGFFGAAIGATAGHALTESILLATDHAQWLEYSWIGALVAAGVMIVLAVALLRVAIMLLTVFQGATMIAAGTLSLLFLHEGWRERIAPAIEAQPAMALAGLGGLCLLGLIVQATGHRRHRRIQDQADAAQNKKPAAD
jgi:hypothetical protein